MRDEAHLLRKLPARELEIASLVFSRGELSAAEVAAALSTPITSSAVRSMLRRLEVKGVLRHRGDGKRFIYFPASSESEIKRRALVRLACEHFHGSLTKMVDEAWNLIRLEALAAEPLRYPDDGGCCRVSERPLSGPPAPGP